jgi:hypothetical protein
VLLSGSAAGGVGGVSEDGAVACSLAGAGVEAGGGVGVEEAGVVVVSGEAAPPVVLAVVAGDVAAAGSWVVSVVTCCSWVAATLGVTGLAAGARSAECISRTLERLMTGVVLGAGLAGSWCGW